MKLSLIRHGETDSNRHGLFQDNTVLLNSFGLQQARLLAQKLERSDALFSSPYTRALHTAQIVDAKMNVGITINESLREIELPSSLSSRFTKETLSSAPFRRQ